MKQRQCRSYQIEQILMNGKLEARAPNETNANRKVHATGASQHKERA
jgi:hypothetical protein